MGIRSRRRFQFSLQKGANPTLKKSESLFYKDLVALVASDKSLRAKERRASEFPALAWGEYYSTYRLFTLLINPIFVLDSQDITFFE